MSDSLTIHESAASMLGLPLDKCPPSLSARLDRIQELCGWGPEDLKSGQVLAHIIFEWELQL